MAKITWGLCSRAAVTIYNGAIEPAMLCAAPVWGDSFRVKELRKLIEAQRVVEVRAAGTYATVLAEAAATISGILPADIWAMTFAKRRDATKNGEEVEIAGHQVCDNYQAKNSLKRDCDRKWESTANGRWTKRFIENANDCCKLGVVLSYQATQLVTERGNFGAYLYRIGHRDDANCECGTEDPDGHVLFDCNEYTQNARETARVLLETFLPGDDADAYDETHVTTPRKESAPNSSN
ncbi:hypothetical protein Trydic_g6524 [Trypoxylus dichotomus]